MAHLGLKWVCYEDFILNVTTPPILCPSLPQYLITDSRTAWPTKSCGDCSTSMYSQPRCTMPHTISFCWIKPDLSFKMWLQVASVGLLWNSQGRLGVYNVLPLSQQEEEPHQNLLEESKLQVLNLAHILNLMQDDLWWKMTFDEMRPLMEYGLWSKTAFYERPFSMEDSLQWKTTFDETMEDDPLWKTNFNGRQPSKECYDGRWPSMERWNMTFNGTMEDDLH